MVLSLLADPGGADVPCRVAFGDKEQNQGHGPNFLDTDTKVIVVENPHGKLPRRVFDAFRAGHHSSTLRPTQELVERWGDMPLTDADKWKGE